MQNMRRLICKMKRNNAHLGLEKFFTRGTLGLFSLAVLVPESVYERMNFNSDYMMIGVGLLGIAGIGVTLYNQEKVGRLPDYQI